MDKSAGDQGSAGDALVGDKQRQSQPGQVPREQTVHVHRRGQPGSPGHCRAPQVGTAHREVIVSPGRRKWSGPVTQVHFEWRHITD